VPHLDILTLGIAQHAGASTWTSSSSCTTRTPSNLTPCARSSRGGRTHPQPSAERETDEVAGFITALSDGAIAASIPLLEVRPQWRTQGLGSHLVRLMVEQLREQYMIDIVCDDDVLPFYERLGFTPWTAAIRRNTAPLGY
jgi:ribosomal protein S18 acetylase RimI-like enzyme